MRIYSASDAETLRARQLLKDWAGEGFLSEAQAKEMERETDCDLRRTNIFLRLVLFFFTVVIVGSALALVFIIVESGSSWRNADVVFLFFSAICYGGAEFVVSKFRLYRHGVEEALAVGSVGFLCAGLVMMHGISKPVVPAVCAAFSLWIWKRFGLWYAFLAAMIFAAILPDQMDLSHAAQHVMVAAIYAIGVGCVAVARSSEYSLEEALLWLGIYVAINLQLSSIEQLRHWSGGALGGPADSGEFSQTFYWATWVLTWCVPPAVLARGVLRKDRCVMAVGAVIGILTLATNKLYLGWPRHTWDPMLLGLALMGVAYYLRRWLASGLAGVRYGFTAERLSGKDKYWMSVASSTVGLVSAQAVTPAAQTTSAEVHFGGGDSGGGGATSNY